ncbi:MAG TPA: hypothetical protein VEK56_15380 [Vicinamibacterales bacterium]|nr:hypothetical protein [Vicinamibacterales bacterium]
MFLHGHEWLLGSLGAWAIVVLVLQVPKAIAMYSGAARAGRGVGAIVSRAPITSLVC